MQTANNLSEIVGVAGVIDPDAYSAATITSGWIDMAQATAILAILQIGDMGASATIDAKLEQATDSSGTGAKDVTDSDITQLTQAGSDDNKQVLIACPADALDVTNDFDHVRLSVTIATAACDFGAVILAGCERYGPPEDYDLSTVDEIVRV